MRQAAGILRRNCLPLLIALFVASVFQVAQVIAQASRPAEQKPSVQEQPRPKLPVSIEQSFYLIRSTLLSLNDANRSGNYTVLRDLAAPAFQAKNSAADLSQHFSDLRQRHFDLFAAAISAPQLSAPPQLDDAGLLRVTGYFKTVPLQINFDLLFQNINNEWRLFGISITTPPAQGQNPTSGSSSGVFESRWPSTVK